MRPRNWSLRARLVAVMVGLLALASVVIGAVMFYAVQNALSAQFDSEVREAAERVVRGGDGGPGGDDYQAAGTVIAFWGDAGTEFGLHYLDGDTADELTAKQLAAIEKVDFGQGVVTVDVPGEPGDYRLVAIPGRVRDGGVFEEGRAVVGLPLSSLNKEIAALLGTIVVVVIAAIVLGALLAALLIRRALRPLRRVATVANDVSRMRLETGEVDLAERVPEHDTNPHTEVGKVGLALNGLLDTVGTALDKRQQSEAKLRTFVADASHELRTPLASIRGYAELTRRFGGPLGEDATHNIVRIESEAKRMTSLVEDLLLLARLDAQRELDERDVDLSRLLVDVVSDAHAAGRDHEWDLELPDDPVVVRGDDARLHQVFTNLLANARVHTPAGTRVTVELKPAVEGAVEICVRDTGPGIPEHLQPTLFERFVRGDSSRQRKTGSTGLGLSIVSAVVQAHHGTVSVESRPGETTFTVRLPVTQPVVRTPSGATAVQPKPVPATV